MTRYDRRTFLALGALTTVGSIAGCSSPSDAGTTPAAGDDSPDTTTAAPTTAPPSTTRSDVGGNGVPGEDVLGGPDDLKSSVDIRATVLPEDEGAGRYVNTPGVVWLQTGGSVTWAIEEGSHSVTAYYSDADKPRRIPEGASGFDSGIREAGTSFSHTFDSEGVYNYFCRPHDSLGMVGLVIVGGPNAGPGTSPPEKIGNGTESQRIARLLSVAGVGGGGDDGDGVSYGWSDATWDSYWYSLYNMSTNIAMSGNGILFPSTEAQQEAFERRFPAMLQAADQEKPPVKNPNLNMAPFTRGDPQFTQQPVFDAGDGRPDADTLAWDRSKSSGVVSPSSVAWTHLKGVTWAKNFQNHFEVLPDDLAAEFRSEVLTTLAQLGVKFALVDGNLRANDENMLLVSEFSPMQGVVDDAPHPNHHAAMLWFLSDLVSLSTDGWFGYENPKPLIPPPKIQAMADGVAKTTMNAFAPETIVETGSTRDLGQMLGAVGWYGTHAGTPDLATAAAEYANALANAVESRVDGNGEVTEGADNRSATQGVVGQGLVWASQVDGVDRLDLAGDVLGYMLDELWDEDAGTFASARGVSTYRISARDAGDVTGGLNAADAVLGMEGVKDVYARYFDETFNRGRLQRAERPPSRDEAAEHSLPLPPKAGGEFGQAAVYNAGVAYDREADEWSVTDATFDTEAALYLANQDIWIGQWGGDFYQGRGVPGRSDTPESG